MKHFALIGLSSLVLVNAAFAGSVNAPAYSHPTPKAHQPVYHPFTGINLTGAIGGILGQGDVKQNVDGQSLARDCTGCDPDFEFTLEDTVVASDNLELFESNVAGLAAIEASYQFNNGLVLAIAGTAGFNNLNMDNTLTMVDEAAVFDTNTDAAFVGLNGISSTISVKLSNDFAILFKPGFVIRKNTMFYALVGPRWGNFQTQLNTHYDISGRGPCDVGNTTECEYYWQSTLSDGKSDSDYELGVTAGVGLRQVITEHFLIGLEYAYTHYGDLDSIQKSAEEFDADFCIGPSDCTYILTSGFSSSAEDLIVDTHTLMGTVSYRF